MWAWRYLCIRMAYKGSDKDGEAFKKAWDNYDANIWASLNAIRSHISQFGEWDLRRPLEGPAFL